MDAYEATLAEDVQAAYRDGVEDARSLAQTNAQKQKESDERLAAKVGKRR